MYLERAKYQILSGVVYCLEHTTVHDDTVDPYGEGRPSCFDNLYSERTKKMVHRPVYVRLQKGDYKPEPGELY